MKGLEKKGRKQMQPISLPLWRGEYTGIVFLQHGLSPTDVFKRWARHQRVGKAEKRGLFNGGAAHGSTDTLQGGRDARGS